MENDYLSKIPIKYKDFILKKSQNDNNFKSFMNNCSKLNLYIFDENGNAKSKIYIIDKLNELKKANIKKYGLNIFKYYSEELDSGIEKMNIHYKKLLLKIEVIDNLLSYIKRYDDDSFKNLFFEISKLKINYSEDVMNTNEVIDFDSSLFMTSDDSEKFKSNIEDMKVNKKDPFLAEYSN